MEGGFGSDKEEEPRNMVAHQGRGGLVKEPCLYFGELGWTHGKQLQSSLYLSLKS